MDNSVNLRIWVFARPTHLPAGFELWCNYKMIGTDWSYDKEEYYSTDSADKGFLLNTEIKPPDHLVRRTMLFSVTVYTKPGGLLLPAWNVSYDSKAELRFISFLLIIIWMLSRGFSGLKK